VKKRKSPSDAPACGRDSRPISHQRNGVSAAFFPVSYRRESQLAQKALSLGSKQNKPADSALGSCQLERRATRIKRRS